jgi:TolB-like protein/Flp pilus assembly protein TadD
VFKVATAYAVVAWLLLQVTELTFDVMQFPPWAMKLAVTFAVVGFPIATLCAWVFQISPQGSVTVDIRAGGEATTLRRKQADLLVIAVLSVSIGLLLYLLFVGGPWRTDNPPGGPSVPETTVSETTPIDSRPERDAADTTSTIARNSIAVLRFINIGDSDYNYISDGISEELLHRFAKLTELFVASRTATWAIPANVDLSVIRERLRVRYVLEGSVRTEDDGLRVTAQLIDTETGFHKWTESYDSPIGDILSLEDKVALAVVQAVGVELSDAGQIQIAQQPTEDSEAYLLYLQGLEYLRMPRDEETLAHAERFFDQALGIDPRFVFAYTGVCELSLARYRLSRAAEHFEAAERACHRALTLDATAKEVYTALGSLYRHSGQFDKAEIEFTKALQLDPMDEDAAYGLARSYQGQGRLQLAEETLRSNIEREPGYWGPYMALGYFLHQFGRYGEAIPYFRKVTELAPDSPHGYTNLGSALYDLGDWESAAVEWRKSVEAAPTSVGYLNLGTLSYHNGEYEDAARLFSKAITLSPENHRLRGKLAAAYRFIDGKQSESQGSYHNAIELAEKNLVINPDDASTLAYLSAYYVNTSQHDKAQETIAKAKSLEQDNPEIWYFSAIVNVQLAKSGASLDDLERAVNLGYSTRLLRADPNFLSLRQDHRFSELVQNDTTPSAGR